MIVCGQEYVHSASGDAFGVAVRRRETWIAGVRLSRKREFHVRHGDVRLLDKMLHLRKALREVESVLSGPCVGNLIPVHHHVTHDHDVHSVGRMEGWMWNIQSFYKV